MRVKLVAIALGLTGAVSGHFENCQGQIQVQVGWRSGEGQVRVRKFRVRSESSEPCELKASGRLQDFFSMTRSIFREH